MGIATRFYMPIFCFSFYFLNRIQFQNGITKQHCETTAALNCHRIILLIRNYELLIRNYELLVRNYELLIRNYELLIRNYVLVIRNS